MATPSIWQTNIKKILWLPTFIMTGLRFVAAALVWTLVLLGLRVYYSLPLTAEVLLFAPIGVATWTILGLISSGLSYVGVPLIGLFAIIGTLIAMVGDPLIWLIVKAKPEFMGLRGFGFLNFLIIPLVLDEGQAEPEIRSEHNSAHVEPEKSESEKLAKAIKTDQWAQGMPHVNPFVGRSIDSLQELFPVKIELRDDGSVYDTAALPNKIGYIDARGDVYDTRGGWSSPDKKIGKVDSEGRVRPCY